MVFADSEEDALGENRDSYHPNIIPYIPTAIFLSIPYISLLTTNLETRL